VHRCTDFVPIAEYPAVEEAIMMQLITADYYGQFINELSEMHRLRHRVFKERLDWDVQISGDMEIDEFDALHPAYLIQRASDNRVQGCVRLLPSTGPTMLRDTFPILLDRAPAPTSATIWGEQPVCAGPSS
jgi:acyl homoserine lactone synthase